MVACLGCERRQLVSAKVVVVAAVVACVGANAVAEVVISITAATEKGTGSATAALPPP